MRTFLAGAVCGLSLLGAVEGTSHASTILVFGDHDALTQLAGMLNDQGHQATRATALPADLSGYDTIWHVGATAPINGDDQARLAAFVSAGHGLYLTGERPSGELMNSTISTLVNSLVGGGVQIGGLGDQDAGAHGFNPGAIGEVAVAPVALNKWAPGASGGIANVGRRNVLTVDADGTATSAAWAGADLAGGQLVVMMDADWLETDPGRATTIGNLQRFLELGAPDDPFCGDGVLAGNELCDDGNGVDDDGCSTACEVPTCRVAGSDCGDAGPVAGEPDGGREPDGAVEPDGTTDPAADQADPGDGDPADAAGTPVGGCSTGGGSSGPLALLGVALALLASRRRPR